MLILAAILIVIPFVALVALAIAAALSLFGIFHEVKDTAVRVAAEKAEAAEEIGARPVIGAEHVAA